MGKTSKKKRNKVRKQKKKELARSKKGEKPALRRPPRKAKLPSGR